MPSSKAVVTTSANECALTDVSVGELGENQVAIRTINSGVSTGTDKWVISGRFEWGNFAFPLVPGYQRSGIVEAIGSKVKNVSIGQQVFATASINYLDATAGWGAHTSYGISEDFEVFDATGIPPARASFGVVAQVGFNAASRIVGNAGDRILVIGDGVIGASGALCAKARGFEPLLLGRHDSRLEKIKSLGIKTANSKIVSRKELSDFAPIAVIDTVQSPDAFELYYRALPATWAAETFGNERTGIGQIIFSGHTPDGANTWADMAHLQKQELTVHFVSGWVSSRIVQTLELMRTGALSLEKIATEYSADDVSIEKLFGNIAAGKNPDIAAYLTWA
ncbi:MAG: alcohol dehydrogenase catalytic domain-containing protein [Actinobacteria bacterium]|nr:alcohol dehydrogenase catalytic domain-containing protein [Actinomycetota bacterium]